MGLGTQQVVEGNNPHRGHGWVCEGDTVHVRVGHGLVEVKTIVF